MGKINIGDWVTQYDAGYWKVRELHPKFSPFKHGSIHKGDRIGHYAVLQKAFGSTFKFNIKVDTCDLSLCSLVTKANLKKIEKYFKEHPEDEMKFETTEISIPPYVTTIFLQIDEEQQAQLSVLIDEALPSLTLPKLKTLLADNGLSEVLPGVHNTYLYLYDYPWNLDENFDSQYFKYEFKRK